MRSTAAEARHRWEENLGRRLARLCRRDPAQQVEVWVEDEGTDGVEGDWSRTCSLPHCHFQLCVGLDMGGSIFTPLPVSTVH
jgi:hypothetical protein